MSFDSFLPRQEVPNRDIGVPSRGSGFENLKKRLGKPIEELELSTCDLILVPMKVLDMGTRD